MKNRFRMYKGPTCTDEEFAALFDGKVVGGIAFTAPTNSKDVERTFCSCGYCSDRAVEKCPECGREIIYLSNRWSTADERQYCSNYSVIKKDPTDAKTLLLEQVSFRAVGEVGTKFFAFESASKVTATLHMENGLFYPDISDKVQSFCFWKGCLKKFTDEYPQYKFLHSHGANGEDAVSFIRMLSTAYALPNIYNNKGFDKCGGLLGSFCFHSGRSLVNEKCEFIIPVLDAHDNAVLRDFPVKNQGKNGRDLQMKEFLWLFGIPPQVEDPEDYAGIFGWEKTMLDTWANGDLENLAILRKWLDTDFGGWMAHLYNNGRVCASYLVEWAKNASTLDEDRLELFYAWLKERVDVMELGSPGRILSSFLKDCDFLKSYGLEVTEDNLREKKLHSLKNEGLYELSTYIDVLEGMKKPTELIIKMAGAL